MHPMPTLLCTTSLHNLNSLHERACAPLECQFVTRTHLLGNPITLTYVTNLLHASTWLATLLNHSPPPPPNDLILTGLCQDSVAMSALLRQGGGGELTKKKGGMILWRLKMGGAWRRSQS